MPVDGDIMSISRTVRGSLSMKFYSILVLILQSLHYQNWVLLCVGILVPACDTTPPPPGVPSTGGGTSVGGGAGSGGSNQWLGTPWATLASGRNYFTHDNVTQPLLMRNIAASSVSEATQLLDIAQASGTQLARMQLTQGFGYDTLGISPSGKVVESRSPTSPIRE